MYGAEVADRYHHWNCSTELQCYGACFTSAQMSVDMVTATSPHRFSLDMVRRSDLIALQLVNPSTYDLMTPDTLTTPVKIQVPIMGEFNDSVHSLQVRSWVIENVSPALSSSLSPLPPLPTHTNIINGFSTGSFRDVFFFLRKCRFLTDLKVKMVILEIRADPTLL